MAPSDPHEAPRFLPSELTSHPIHFRQARDGRLLEVDSGIVTLTGTAMEAWTSSSDCFWRHIQEQDRNALREWLFKGRHRAEPVHCQRRIRYPISGLEGMWVESRRWMAEQEVFEGYWIDHSLVWRFHQRLEAMQGRDLLNDLLPGYVHDLNNALTGVVSLADLCLLEMPSGHSMESHLRQLAGNAGAMGKMLRSLAHLHEEQDPARPRAAQWHDISQVARDAVALARPAIPRRITLDLTLSEAPLPVVGEGAALQRGLIQLLLNAAKAIPGKGTIRIETEIPSAPPASCRDIPHARIIVTDTGVGMDARVAGSVFDLAYSTRAGRGGIGSGLHYLQGTVKAMGGEVHLESAPDRGTTISCYLPLANEDDASCDPDAETATARKPLVVVDLVGDDAEGLLGQLQNGPWTVLTLGSQVERVLASGGVPGQGLLIWGGNLKGTSLWQLECLYRYRPRLSMFLVTSGVSTEVLSQVVGWVDEAVTLEAPDLLDGVGRWFDFL